MPFCQSSAKCPRLKAAELGLGQLQEPCPSIAESWPTLRGLNAVYLRSTDRIADRSTVPRSAHGFLQATEGRPT